MTLDLDWLARRAVDTDRCYSRYLGFFHGEIAKLGPKEVLEKYVFSAKAVSLVDNAAGVELTVTELGGTTSSNAASSLGWLLASHDPHWLGDRIPRFDAACRRVSRSCFGLRYLIQQTGRGMYPQNRPI